MIQHHMEIDYQVRILLAHNRYQHQGGEDTVVDQEEQMLKSAGHDVERLQVDNDSIVGIRGQLSAALGSFFSVPSYSLALKHLRSFKPNVLHVHNLFPRLSPAVYYAAAQAQVPVVQTLHNYRLVCVAGSLFREGTPCEDCLAEHSFVPGVRHSCYRGSRAGSAVVGTGTAIHQILGTWSQRVHRYITLTEFATDIIAGARIPRSRISLKPNFSKDVGIGNGSGDFALFVGRLSEDKGIEFLIQADLLGHISLPIAVVGVGPLGTRLREACSRPGSRLTWLGRKSKDEVRTLMKSARVLVLPSLWYEGFPMVAVEALSLGLPILASRIGGLPEIIEDAVSGILFTPGDIQSFAAALLLFTCNRERELEMRSAARRRFLERYTEQLNYDLLIRIYDQVISEYAG